MAKLKRINATVAAEGVRLDVGRYAVLAVRNADKDISLRLRREPRRLERALMRVPFVRGAARLALGPARLLDALAESAELRPQAAETGTAAERALARALRVRPQAIVAWLDAMLMLLLSFLCLWAAPEGVEVLLRHFFDLPRLGLRAAVSATRACGALLAIYCGGRLRTPRRLLMYRGALAKAINCYECRDRLTPACAAEYPLHARRSESAFFALSLALSLFAVGMLPQLGAAARLGVALGVAALVNEPYRALEEARLTPLVRALRLPMDLMQHMTALEPEMQMLEVAVCAIEAALGERDREVKAS